MSVVTMENKSIGKKSKNEKKTETSCSEIGKHQQKKGTLALSFGYSVVTL